VKCKGTLWVTGWTNDEVTAPPTFRVYALCDSLPGCGFDKHLWEHDGDTTWGITNEEMTDLQIEHITHSKEVAARDAG
jgi:hypothetical protein